MAAKKRRKKAPAKARPSAKKTTQRARETPSKKPTKAERIDHIVGLMTSGLFVTGRTVRELAREWNLHLSTVKADSAEASRTVTAAFRAKEGEEDDRAEEIRARLCATLEAATAGAMNAKEWRSIAALTKEYAEIVGAKAPTEAKHKHEFGDLDSLLRSVEWPSAEQTTSEQTESDDS